MAYPAKRRKVEDRLSHTDWLCLWMPFVYDLEDAQRNKNRPCTVLLCCDKLREHYLLPQVHPYYYVPTQVTTDQSLLQYFALWRMYCKSRYNSLSARMFSNSVSILNNFFWPHIEAECSIFLGTAVSFFFCNFSFLLSQYYEKRRMLLTLSTCIENHLTYGVSDKWF